jgi:hypothetical protein
MPEFNTQSLFAGTVIPCDVCGRLATKFVTGLGIYKRFRSFRCDEHENPRVVVINAENEPAPASVLFAAAEP